MKYKPNYLEIELTDICNAACPMCHRTVTSNTKPNNSAEFLTNKTQITFEVFKKIIDNNPRVEQYNFCGNWGDPITAKDFLKIIEYIANKDSIISIHTNGGLRSKSWWKTLGNILSVNPKNSIVFGIDGLEDTNHIYRRHTNFNKIIENAKSFIDNTKANSTWSFIKFKHNQHQIEDARSYAKEIGFKYFSTTDTARFERRGIDKFEFFEDGKQLFLEPPTDKTVYNYQDRGQIDCLAIAQKKIYLSCEAKIWPCCWIETDYRMKKDPTLNSIIEMSDITELDATQHTFEKIIKSDIFSLIETNWVYNKPNACYNKCKKFILNDIKAKNIT
jgi:MoaA/NifB/PqqE/SkfB family radical SAM enzyme